MSKRLLSVLLIASIMMMTVFGFPVKPLYVNAEAVSTADSEVKGAHYFGNGSGPDRTDDFVYSDDYFIGDSSVYSNQLARASFELCICSFSSHRGNDTARNFREYFEDNGFSDFEANKGYTEKADSSSAAAACAHKKITENGKEYTLLAVIPRSGTIDDEWISGTKAGKDKDDKGDFAGYLECSDKILEFTRDYIRKNNLSGSCKLWIAGYSRGAAIADLMGAAILRNPEAALGGSLELKGRDLYCYTFGTPRVASLSGDYADSRFDSIHNVCDGIDLITHFGTADAFTRYGQDHPYVSAANKARMLELLKEFSEDSYSLYIRMFDPDDYSPLKTDMNAIKKGSFAFAADPDSYLPYEQAEYNESESRTVAALFAKSSASGEDSREGYVAEYQKSVGDFLSYFGHYLIGGDILPVIEGISKSKTTIPMVLSMYAMVMTEKSATDKSIKLNTVIEDSFNRIASLIEDEDGNLKSSLRTLKYYKTLRDGFFVKDGEEGSQYRLRFSLNAANRGLLIKSLRALTASLYSMTIKDIMTYAGADQSKIRTISSYEESYVMSYMLAYVMMINEKQSSGVKPLNPENEQFKQMATFGGNMSRLFAPHIYTNFLAWLRSYDASYDNYASPDEAQLAGYRRVFIDKPADVDINGIVTDDNGKTAATFRNGKIITRSDDWIGYTNSDSGSWLRLPLDKNYTVELTVSNDTKLNIRLAEYSVSEGKEVRTVSSDSRYSWNKLKSYKNGTVRLSVPAAGAGKSGYVLPTDENYSISVSGTAAPKTKYSSSVPKIKNVRVKAGKKSLTVSWKKHSAKQRAKFTRTEIQYSTSKNFRSYKIVYASRAKASHKIKGLKEGVKYYVRVRNVKKTSAVKYVSKWSAVKSAKVK